MVKVYLSSKLIVVSVVPVPKDVSVIKIISVDSKGLITGSLSVLDKPIANAIVVATMNNTKDNLITDNAGLFQFQAADGYRVAFEYAGNETTTSSDTSIMVNIVTPPKNPSIIKIVSVDSKRVITGSLTVLGDPIADAIVVASMNGTDVNLITDADGLFTFQAETDLEVTFKYDGDFNKTDADASITLNIPPVTNVTVVVDGKEYAGELINGTVVINTDVPETPDVNVTIPAVQPGKDTVVDVALPADANGTVAVYVDGKKVGETNVANGTATVPVSALDAGNHVVEVRYSGDDKYAAAIETKEVDVAKFNSTISATSAEITEGETAVINVNVDADATGGVLIDVGGNKFYADVVNGVASVNIVGLAAGNYVADVVYLGDDNYAEAKGSANITVNAKPEPATSDVNITMPVDFKVDEEANVTVGIPDASGNVSVIVDGVESVVALDENGTAVVPINMTPGEHSVVVVYLGDETHAPAVKSATTNVAILTSQFKNLTLNGDLVLTGVLVDSMGDVIPNATITYAIGAKKGTLTTGADGSFTIAAENNVVVSIAYEGTSDVVGTNIDITIQNIAPSRLSSEFNVTEGISIKTYAVDTPAGEIGQTTSFRLTDSNGNPIVNATVKFAYKTVILNRTTDENGIVFIGINTQVAQEALCAMSYLGDEKYNATFVAFSFDIQKKPITITASAKTYKASAKTKKYTVTIKTEKCNSLDGKVYLSAGKKITMKVNGKTYTAKTNAKGQATFNLNISKKGKFTASVKFAGDKTYASASKSVKITVK